MKLKNLIAPLCGMLAVIGTTACGSEKTEVKVEPANPTINVEPSNPTINVEPANPTINIINQTTKKADLKYVFLFIGDGMSYPQIQSASYYLSATKTGIDNGNKKDVILSGNDTLGFMNFQTTGTARTYDATSFAPDSASTATSIATGEKTWSGSINVSTSFDRKYETIAEKLKDQKNFKIGIVSSVNLNHATPAAFYAHQNSRNSYDAISDELIASDFDYFAGGRLLGNYQEKYQKAEENGYVFCDTRTEVEALKPGQKAIIQSEVIADGGAMSYAMDYSENELKLKDYVKKGIEQLDNENGFFMMCEGGKIDWACHANDAAAAIHDTIDFANAVDEAVKFYNNHKEETLILVTGDHETGGLSIGYAGTDYNTYMTNLANQKISFKKFDTDYVSQYKSARTEFTTVLNDVKSQFGLVAKSDPAAATTRAQLVLTDSEYAKLEQAYNDTLNGYENTYENKILYGGYTPLSVTLTHILNNKSGISFSSYAHTGLPTAVFAQGNGAENFGGFYDNTDIYKKMASLVSVC